jgi:hypothetical protein
MEGQFQGQSKERLLRSYKNMIGYKINIGIHLEQAKAEEEAFRLVAGLPKINKPAQYFIDWVNGLLD